MRPSPSDGAPAEAVSERQQRTATLAGALIRGIPLEPELRGDGQAASWLLANLLDWHRREAKADWWEYFRMKDLIDEDLLDERSAIAGLRFVEPLKSCARFRRIVILSISRRRMSGRVTRSVNMRIRSARSSPSTSSLAPSI